MKRILTAIVFTLKLTLLYGQHYNSNYGKPLVVLNVTGPWMTLGSDIPSFAIYEKGQIIFMKMVAKKVRLFEIKLKPDEINETIRSLGITDSLRFLPKFINVSNASDQLSYELTINIDSVKKIAVYGDLSELKSEDRIKTPATFLKVYDNLVNFKRKEADEWLPDKIEVVAIHQRGSPKLSIKWPSGWPDLYSKTTIKRDDYPYNIYLKKKYFLQLKKIAKQELPVKIDGQFFIIYYRLPFPNIQ